MEKKSLVKAGFGISLSGMSENDVLGLLSSKHPGLISSNRESSSGNIIYVVLDCSASMAEGVKMKQTKNGILDFSKSAIQKGYRVGLISFSDSADTICLPTNSLMQLSDSLKKAHPLGSTNMCQGIKLAISKLVEEKGKKVMLLATDGMPNSKKGALNSAKEAKSKKIEIMIIGTYDADREFLEEIATAKELAAQTDFQNQSLSKSFSNMAEKLMLPAPK